MSDAATDPANTGGTSLLEIARAMADEPERHLLLARLQAVLGKTFKASGAFHPYPLIVHLIDTAQVGSLVWDAYLPRGLRDALDRASADRGRQCFMWICGMHDWGKATVAFNRGDVGAVAAPELDAQGLHDDPAAPRGSTDVPHAVLTRFLFNQYIRGSGDPSLRGADWLIYVLEGHHGVFSSPARDIALNPGSVGAPAGWGAYQRAVPEVMARLTGFDSALDAMPRGRLTTGEQYALAGYVAVADKIASSLLENKMISQNPWLADRNLALAERIDHLTLAANEQAVDRIWHLNGTDRFPAMWTKLTEGRGRSAPDALAAAVRARDEPALFLVDAALTADSVWEAARTLIERFELGGFHLGVPDEPSRLTWSSAIDAELTAEGLDGSLAPLLSYKAQPALDGTWFYQSADRRTLLPATVDVNRQLWESVQLPVPKSRENRDKEAKGSVVTIQFAGFASKAIALTDAAGYCACELRCLEEALMWLASAGAPVILEVAGLSREHRRRLASAYARGIAETYPVELPANFDGPAEVTAVYAVDGRLRIDTTGTATAAPLRTPKGCTDECPGDEIESRLLSRPGRGSGAWPVRTLKGLFEP
ncbi:CRISPR-associated endonuclease Cas3'' [Glycomyces harbinensis]|nr:CRISPR-associated endonuclease Cas3'' [Glycomyces harbinensis]